MCVLVLVYPYLTESTIVKSMTFFLDKNANKYKRQHRMCYRISSDSLSRLCDYFDRLFTALLLNTTNSHNKFLAYLLLTYSLFLLNVCVCMWDFHHFWHTLSYWHIQSSRIHAYGVVIKTECCKRCICIIVFVCMLNANTLHTQAYVCVWIYIC